MINISISSQEPSITLTTWKELSSLRVPYEEIWEKDGKWLGGKDILTRIVKHWQLHLPSPTVEDHGTINLNFQFPKVKDEISGKEVPIELFIPISLRPIYQSRLEEIARLRFSAWEIVLAKHLGEVINNQLYEQIKADMINIETRAKMEDAPEFWEIGCVVFGLPTLIEYCLTTDGDQK